MSHACPTASTHLDGAQGIRGLTLLEQLFAEQEQLTAVDKFAQWHADAASPTRAKHYRDLIPLALPTPGQQYAFEVDLDACSGCKACVTACHNLNGLEPHEVWRSVGLLHGGTSHEPFLQHVTTACHHCVQPACLEGCPVNAYEKDPLTGIVRHLDDQCIGCQYCVWTCPYEVPRYSRSKGIVRKCDMCRERLAVGEAPACVQACPNQAIRIRLLDHQAVLEAAEANRFLPGTPDPSYTLPSTVYKTKRAFPHNVLPADYYSASVQHSHWPLVLMLVFTQMSVGAFAVEQVLLHGAKLGEETWQGLRAWHLATALLLGLLGLAAAVLHLGRPLYAYRALLGWRRSWLSREILAFGLFAATASAYVASAALSAAGGAAVLPGFLGGFATGSGLAGIACSVMIYVDTRRPLWSPATTACKFFLTAAVLGVPVVLLNALLAAAVGDDISVRQVVHDLGRTLCLALAAATAGKLLVEALVFAHLRQRSHTPLKRSAMLLTGELSMSVLKRNFCGVIGGIVLPLLLWAEKSLTGAEGFEPLFVVMAVALILALSIAGELLERSLFFAASVAPRMPGGPAA